VERNYRELATTDYGNILGRECFLDFAIHALWEGMDRIAGPAFTVQLAPGDNLMLHAAIYEAPQNSILVIDGVDTRYAVAGGNVCAVAKGRGILGFVIDGVIRDLAEIEELNFPVFAKGVFPVPGGKKVYAELAQPITCGGVRVHTGDLVVADREGIVCIPRDKAAAVFDRAQERADRESRQSLEDWQRDHQKKIAQAIQESKSKA